MSIEKPADASKPKTIRIGVAYDHTLDMGGVETHLVALFKLAQQHGFDYVLFAPASDRFRKLIEPLGVELVPWEKWNIYDLRIPFKLKSLFKRFQIDLIHVHSPTAGVHGRLAAWLAGIPTLITVHLPVYLYHGRLSTWKAVSGRIIYTWIDRIFNYLLTSELIYVSKSILNQCVEKKISPAGISLFIPNGVDTNFMDKLPPRETLREQFGTRPEDCIMIFAGRLDDQKGVDLLPEILAPLHEEYPNLNLWVVGEGPLRYTIENQIREMGLEKRVKFWDYQQDIKSFLIASDIFILPSRYEALPFVLLEALAAGLPCIVTDTGDNNILVEQGVNGIVVPVSGIKEFQNAVKALVSDRSLRIKQGAASRKIALDYDEEKSVTQVFDRYAKIAANTTGK